MERLPNYVNLKPVVKAPQQTNGQRLHNKLLPHSTNPFMSSNAVGNYGQRIYKLPPHITLKPLTTAASNKILNQQKNCATQMSTAYTSGELVSVDSLPSIQQAFGKNMNISFFERRFIPQGAVAEPMPTYVNATEVPMCPSSSFNQMFSPNIKILFAKPHNQPSISGSLIATNSMSITPSTCPPLAPIPLNVAIKKEIAQPEPISISIQRTPKVAPNVLTRNPESMKRGKIDLTPTAAQMATPSIKNQIPIKTVSNVQTRKPDSMSDENIKLKPILTQTTTQSKEIVQKLLLILQSGEQQVLTFTAFEKGERVIRDLLENVADIPILPDSSVYFIPNPVVGLDYVATVNVKCDADVLLTHAINAMNNLNANSAGLPEQKLNGDLQSSDTSNNQDVLYFNICKYCGAQSNGYEKCLGCVLTPQSPQDSQVIKITTKTSKFAHSKPIVSGTFPEVRDVNEGSNVEKQNKIKHRKIVKPPCVREDVARYHPLVYLNCRTIRIGEHKFDTKNQVLMSPKGIQIKAPTVKNTDLATLNIKKTEICRIMYNQQYKIMILFVQPICGVYIRQSLLMDKSLAFPSFVPESENATRTKIVMYFQSTISEISHIISTIRSTYLNTVVEEISFDAICETMNFHFGVNHTQQVVAAPVEMRIKRISDIAKNSAIKKQRKTT